MKYSKHRVNLRLYHRIALYIFLVLEIALGSALLFYSYSQYIVDKKELDSTMKYIEDSTTSIMARPNTVEYLTYEDYTYINENIFKNTKSHYTVNATLNFDYSRTGKIALVFMSHDEMKETFGISPQAGTAYIGEEAKKVVEILSKLQKSRAQVTIDDGMVSFGANGGHYLELNDMDIDFTANSIKFLDQEFEFVDIPVDTKEKMLITSPVIQTIENDKAESLLPNQPKGKYMIIVPVEYAKEIDKIIRPWQNRKMAESYNNIAPRISIKNFEKAPEEVWQAIDYLKSKYPNANFAIDDPKTSNKAWIEYKKQTMSKYLLISILLLVIVSVITSGIFLLLHQGRKKEIAISLACGSTVKDQIKELLMEISALIFYGMVVGVAAAYMYGDIAERRFYEKYNGYRGLNIKTNVEPFLMLILAAVIILIISSALSIRATRKLNPTEILQNE